VTGAKHVPSLLKIPAAQGGVNPLYSRERCLVRVAVTHQFDKRGARQIG
jgi:hypothetical protein